ncbi:hypothetical protein BGW36DRAFT_436650 [Talaromyces proteolyticus]|uniref:Uncharacterized protein n=1 Tax=Talaromyces proteolyticus TaxID=1131652 RepID=A0AAD4KK67_9EURO|nr:uncharacterized protein BGW36DRAFT_436650 [Talaromyces proteolyticus]KAH8692893.1 hypothetical protein BGW36DRAFT_436650 [Talaromyces proteolyticus]
MTETPNISPYFACSANALTRLVRLYDDERNGEPKMTSADIVPEIEEWLARQGFTKDEDILELEEAGTSLVHACLMLAQELPRCPAQYKASRGSKVIPPLVRKPGVTYDPDQRGLVRKLYQRVNCSKEIQDEPAKVFEASSIEAQNTTPQILDNEVELDDIIQHLEISEQDQIEASEIVKTDEGFCLAVASNDLGRSHRRYLWSDNSQSMRVDRLRESLLAGREFKAGWRDGCIHVHVHTTMRLSVVAPRKEFSRVLVQVELTENERHPQVWAVQARNDEPASRLAFKITIIYPGGQEGDEVVLYPQDRYAAAPYKANGFVDWINGDNPEAIASRPRRHLHIPNIAEGVPEHLKQFIGGGYTDDKAQGFKLFHDITRNGSVQLTCARI